MRRFLVGCAILGWCMFIVAPRAVTGQAGGDNAVYLPSVSTSPLPDPEPEWRPDGYLVENGGFEAGYETGYKAWEQYSSLDDELIYHVDDMPEGLGPNSGAWAAWLGGDNDEVAVLLQWVTLPSETPQPRYWLRYSLRIESADDCGHDTFRVELEVEGGHRVPLDTDSLCVDTATDGYVETEVEIGRFGGVQTFVLIFTVETDADHPSHLSIDDVELISKP